MESLNKCTEINASDVKKFIYGLILLHKHKDSKQKTLSQAAKDEKREMVFIGHCFHLSSVEKGEQLCLDH